MPRRSRLLAALLLAVAAVLWAARPSQADADGSEAQALAAIDEILNDADLPSAFWGIEIRDEAGRMVCVSRCTLAVVPVRS